MAFWSRKPRRVAIARWRYAAAKGEDFIGEFEFPPHIRRRVLRRVPEVGDESWPLVEEGLREWFIASAWRGRTMLGMPSRVVDEAWHEFILDSLAYTAFCEGAFGEYLHHTPDEAMSVAMTDVLGNTVRAWDRSAAGRRGESLLWELDRQLGLSNPLGVDEHGLRTARNRASERGAGPVVGGCVGTGAAAYGLWGGGGGDGYDGGGSCAGGGDSGGGGCGGGGCGGGS